MPLTAPKSMFEHPSYGPLLRAAEDVRKARSYDMAPEAMLALLHNAQANLRGGMEALMEPDPLKQDMAKVIFILQRSAYIKEKRIGDVVHKIPTVTNMEGFRVVVEECHEIAEKYCS